MTWEESLETAEKQYIASHLVLPFYSKKCEVDFACSILVKLGFQAAWVEELGEVPGPAVSQFSVHLSSEDKTVFEQRAEQTRSS